MHKKLNISKQISMLPLMSLSSCCKLFSCRTDHNMKPIKDISDGTIVETDPLLPPTKQGIIRSLNANVVFNNEFLKEV